MIDRTELSHSSAAAEHQAGEPLFAIVVPVGSVDERLERQLKALTAQVADFPFEIVLSVNTNGRDDLAAIERIVAQQGGITTRSVLAADRRGAAYARNVGAAATSAPLLAFCDADDEVHSVWLDALRIALDDHDAVTGHVNELAPRGQEKWRPPATPGALPTFLGHPYVLSGNLAIRRDVFLAVGGFDERLTRCEDIALGWSLVRNGYRIGYAPDAVLDYHHRSGLRSMLYQHLLYGIGMSEVVLRHGVPQRAGEAAPRLAMLRSNAQTSARTPVQVLRRGSIACGRVIGLARESVGRARRRRAR